jgi:hypothetical protein
MNGNGQTMKHRAPAGILGLLLLALVPSFSQAQEQMADCVQKASAIHEGMTRGQLAAYMVHDGGPGAAYKQERLAFVGPPGEKAERGWWKQEMCMLSVDFRPFGLAEATYRDASLFAQWVQTHGWHPDPRDVATKISAPFIDSYHY